MMARGHDFDIAAFADVHQRCEKVLDDHGMKRVLGSVNDKIPQYYTMVPPFFTLFHQCIKPYKRRKHVLKRSALEFYFDTTSLVK